MKIEYYVLDKNEPNSKDTGIAIEVLEGLAKFQDLHKDTNVYNIYSFKDSPKNFEQNSEIRELLGEQWERILPIVCVDEKIYKKKQLLSIFELSELTGYGISYQEMPEDLN